MIISYLKIAIRNILKDRFYSFINVMGLAVGISVFMLISLFALNELSYDKFHLKADRIYRYVTHLSIGGNITDLNSTFPPFAKSLETEIPEIEQATRIYSQNGKIFQNEEIVFSEDDVLYADPNFFDVFDFELLTHKTNNLLSKPNQLLLTPALVQKYFATKDVNSVVGKSIQVNGELFEITGVVAPSPQTSHFKYSSIISMVSTPTGRDERWNSMNLSTYVLLKAGTSIDDVNRKIPDVLKKSMPGFDGLQSRGIIIEPISQSLTSIHLYSNVQGEFQPNGSIGTVYILGSIAIIVLLLASVNFINLVTARSANRAKEVGVRKVLGSLSSQLIRQFTLESIMLVLISALLSLGIVELLRYPFNELAGKELPFSILLTPETIMLMIIFSIFLGILAGGYPAFYLASFQPAAVLKGKLRSGFRSSRLRNVLVTMQFSISIVLITCTFIVRDQLSFMRSKKLGFDKENLLILDNADRTPNIEVFKNAVEEFPFVENTGVAQFQPVGDYDGMPVTTSTDRDNERLVNLCAVDFGYLPTLKYELLDGRFFSADRPSDSSTVILNARAAEFLFGTKDVIGKQVFTDDISYDVIGVIKDFNFESLRNEVRPLIFFSGRNERFLHIRLLPGDHEQAIQQIQALWKTHHPDIPFSYSFLDENYKSLFQNEQRLGTLFTIFTVLALFIACLGLLGLAAYMGEQRRKEFSVRKVLGASLPQVFGLMAKEFIKVIAIASLLAMPIGYWIMNEWLNGFAYRVDISPILLLGGSLTVIGVALITVSYQSIRSAMINPVKALKEE